MLSDSQHHVKAKLKNGQIFGEVSLVGNIPRRITVKAITHVDIFSLSKGDLDNVLKYYPAIAAKVKDIGHNKYDDLLQYYAHKAKILRSRSQR